MRVLTPSFIGASNAASANTRTSLLSLRLHAPSLDDVPALVPPPAMASPHLWLQKSHP